MPIEPIEQYLIEEFHIKPLKPVTLEPYDGQYLQAFIERRDIGVIDLCDYVKWLEKQWKENRNK